LVDQIDQVLRERRSVRQFTDNAVSTEQLEQLVALGTWAPSAGNAQSWRFVIVRDARTLKALHAVSPGMLAAPSAIIAVCQDEEKAYRIGGRLGRERCAVMDSAMAAQNILLAAHARGLGTCPILSFHAEAVGQLLDLPETVKPHLLIAVGYPATAPKPPARAVEGVVFVDRYGK
jgi:nitroreductase